MSQKLIHWFHFSSPQTFFPLAGKLWPLCAVLGTVLGLAGLWLGLFVAPTDFQQGEGYRIIFVHVLLSLLILPLYVPVLVFGAGAVQAQVAGLGASAHVSILMAMLLLAAFFSPWACAAALRIAME